MAATPSKGLSTVPADRRVALINEKVTGPAAAEMLRRSKILDSHSDGVGVLDNATGGGILVAELLWLAAQHRETLSIGRVVAGDKDEKMLSFAQQTKQESLEAGLEGWKKVEIANVDQQAIPFPDVSFHYVFANFGIFFCTEDDKALAETYRVLKSGGTAGFTSWKSLTWWPEVAQPALKQFLPEAPELPSPGKLFPTQGWSDPAAIATKLEKAGFEDLQVAEYSFTPDVEAEDFAKATAVLINVVAQRLWPRDAGAKYATQIESAILRFLENYEDGKWDGELTAIISLGVKP